jgi:hypothetical protein
MCRLKNAFTHAWNSIFFIKYRNVTKNIYYKIIDKNNRGEYLLQLVNSKSVFCSSIDEIVFDIDILHGLHSLQSCFIGIEYAIHMKSNKIAPSRYCKDVNLTVCHFPSDLFLLKIKHQYRNGDICYINVKTNEEFTKPSKEIAFSDHIIEKFHPGEAFHIGMCTGLKLHEDPSNIIHLDGIRSKKKDRGIN